MSGEAFDRVLDVNLHGVHRTVEAALPEIVRRRGHIVLVASIYAFINGTGALRTRWPRRASSSSAGCCASSSPSTARA
jgi:NAD(P)-dependent dehydrogenase (short-subunit alcohol dehydrogenase family)